MAQDLERFMDTHRVNKPSLIFLLICIWRDYSVFNVCLCAAWCPSDWYHERDDALIIEPCQSRWIMASSVSIHRAGCWFLSLHFPFCYTPAMVSLALISLPLANPNVVVHLLLRIPVCTNCRGRLLWTLICGLLLSRCAPCDVACFRDGKCLHACGGGGRFGLFFIRWEKTHWTYAPTFFHCDVDSSRRTLLDVTILFTVPIHTPWEPLLSKYAALAWRRILTHYCFAYLPENVFWRLATQYRLRSKYPSTWTPTTADFSTNWNLALLNLSRVRDSLPIPGSIVLLLAAAWFWKHRYQNYTQLLLLLSMTSLSGCVCLPFSIWDGSTLVWKINDEFTRLSHSVYWWIGLSLSQKHGLLGLLSLISVFLRYRLRNYCHSADGSPWTVTKSPLIGYPKKSAVVSNPLRTFERNKTVATRHTLHRPMIAVPDVGYLTLSKEYNVLDMENSPPVLAKENDTHKIRTYFFEVIAPDFIELLEIGSVSGQSITGWAFRSMYEPVRNHIEPCPIGGSGLWVRKDMLSKSNNNELSLMMSLQSGMSWEIFETERDRRRAENTIRLPLHWSNHLSIYPRTDVSISRTHWRNSTDHKAFMDEQWWTVRHTLIHVLSQATFSISASTLGSEPLNFRYSPIESLALPIE